MSTWSSYSEFFYRQLLENNFYKRGRKHHDKNLLKNVLDCSCSNISVYLNTPQSYKYYNDNLFFVPDSLNDGQSLLENEDFLNCKINSARVIYKTQGNHTSRHINNLLAASGNVVNSSHSIPYESSKFFVSNSSKYEQKAISKTNLFTILQRETVNTLETVYLYNNKSRHHEKPVVIKPSGVLNAGIMGLELGSESSEEDITLSVNDVFTVYPSCFFSYKKKKSDYFMDPYVESSKTQDIKCSWDGYSVKSKIYSDESPFMTVNEDLEVLEIKTDNKSLFSSTIYARNALGILVFRYYYDDGWKVKTLNNVSYTDKDKVYYMCVSPYVSDEAVFLKTSNELLLYDAHLCHERDIVNLSNMIRKEDDIVQTVGYGMDNNSLILGGNKLYHLDKRSPKLYPLLLPIQSTITVTSTKWTERKFDNDQPTRKIGNSLSGRSCSFLSYWRSSKPSFWKSFTAFEKHPVFNHIIAAVCGTSNCILIFDLRIPNAPLLDIPLSSTEFMGSRFRSLKWFLHNKETFLFAFSCRQKYPICAKFTITSCFTDYSVIFDGDHTFADFELFDSNYDTLVMFERSYMLNFLNVNQQEEDSDFPNYGPSVQTQNVYFELPIHFTKDSAMTNIFHGFMGFTPVHLPSKNDLLAMVYTTSGKLLCIDLNNKKVHLKREFSQESRGYSEIDLEDATDFCEGFNIAVRKNGGIPFPKNIEFDSDGCVFNIKKTEIENKYTNFTPINVGKNFVKIQEQHFGDERRYSSFSINNIYEFDDKVEKFNSREFLEKVMAFDKALDEDDKHIISLNEYTKSHGIENLNSYQSWNPLDNKLESEYQTELKNPFTKDSEICSCSSLNKTQSDLDKKMAKILVSADLNDHRNSSNKRSRQNTQKDKTSDHYKTEKLDSIREMLVNMLENKESLMLDEGLLNTFGSMILLDSDLPLEHEYVQTNEVDHREDCPASDIVSVEVSKETDELEPNPMVDELISTWVTEPRKHSLPELHPLMIRSYDPGDVMEFVRDSRRSQDEVLSQLLKDTQ